MFENFVLKISKICSLAYYDFIKALPTFSRPEPKNLDPYTQNTWRLSHRCSRLHTDDFESCEFSTKSRAESIGYIYIAPKYDQTYQWPWIYQFLGRFELKEQFLSDQKVSGSHKNSYRELRHHLIRFHNFYHHHLII